MKTTAIIAEYNPLHEGHLYHIKKAKEVTGCDCLVVILTTCFGQRGLPSLIAPQDKAKLALEAGANLVLELPSVYAAQSADYFAKYAIESLSVLPVDYLCFGSETDNLDYLTNLSKKISSLDKNPALSLARSSAMQLAELEPNDILGMQYIRWCSYYGITPVCIKRNDSYKSATQTRKDFENGEGKQFKEEYFIKEQNWDNYYPYLRLFLLMSHPEHLRETFLCEEGIEFRLIQSAKECKTWKEFLEKSITKTYSRARIQRTCLFLMLQISKKDVDRNNHFFKAIVRGFDNTGREFLSTIKDKKKIATRFNELDSFLKMVQIKSRVLYESVMTEPIKEWKVIYED